MVVERARMTAQEIQKLYERVLLDDSTRGVALPGQALHVRIELEDKCQQQVTNDARNVIR